MDSTQDLSKTVAENPQYINQTSAETPQNFQANLSSNVDYHQIFTSTQMATLQHQVRVYKALSTRHAAKFNNHPSTNAASSAAANVAASSVPASGASVLAPSGSSVKTYLAPASKKPQPITKPNPSPSVQTHSQHHHQVAQTLPPPPRAAPENTAWHALTPGLFFNGPNPTPDAMTAVPFSDTRCYVFSPYPPLVVTRPYAATLREQALSKLAQRHIDLVHNSSTAVASSAHATDFDYQVSKARASYWYSVYKRRQDLASRNDHTSTSTTSVLSPTSVAAPIRMQPDSILPWRRAVRSKPQRRDLRREAQEERRRRAEVEDRQKRRWNEFQRALLAHREEFTRYHRQKKSECSKVARLVRASQEQQEAKKEKEDAKAELRRMQALRENDMEAYTKLLQETKNDRLHFLVSQTDTYIQTINEMVRNQGLGADLGITVGPTVPTTTAPSSSSATNGTIAGSRPPAGGGAVRQEYYANTHRRTETVSQPRSLQGGDLKEYQLSGLQWMISLYNNNLNGILADEMGLGKTIQTIALLAYLMENKNNRGPFLVVVPLSTLSNWVNEFSKWAPHIIKVVFKGAPAVRKQLFKDQVETGAFNLLITTYEYIMRDKGSLRKITWQYIIVDEGHRMKNAESKFAQTLGSLYVSKHRLLLTGTPLQNNLPELWALLNFLLPSIFSSMDTFDQWFNRPFAAFKNPIASQAQSKDGDGESAALTQEEKMLIVNRLHEVIRPFMLRRVKDQVLDQLPDKVEKVVRCGLSGFQKRLYNAIHSRSIAGKDKDGLDSAIGSSGLNNAIMQLRKVCNHPYLFLDEWYVDEDLIRASGKFALLDKMLPKLMKAGHRVLMFSQMTKVMTILERYFDLRGFRHMRLDGGTAADERERLMYVFNDPDSPYFVFLLSTRAGGLGLNLATADTVILFDSDWNPMADAQAQDRAHRIGQKNEVRVFRLVSASPVEERILARATDKRNLTGLVVEAGRFGTKAGASSGGAADEHMMQTLLQEMSMSGTGVGADGAGTSSGGGLEDGEEEEEEAGLPDDDQLNELMATSDSELQLYQQMDRERANPSALSLSTSSSRNYDSSGLSHRRPPLMCADESPAWLLPHHWAKNTLLMDALSHDAAEKAQASSSSSGHGQVGRKKGGTNTPQLLSTSVLEDEGVLVGGKVMRKRKEVVYDDNLTERQFVRLVEKAGGDLPPVNSSAEGGGTVEMHPVKRMKLVPLAGTGSGDARELAVLRPLSDADSGVLETVVKQSLSSVLSPDGTRDASGLFLVKPDKKLYPDYYNLVAAPISLKEIAAGLHKRTYTCFAEVEYDLALLVVNARTYNGEASFVFLDAQSLRRVFYTECARRGLPSGSELCIPLPTDGDGAEDISLFQLPPLAASYRALVDSRDSGDFVATGSIQSLCPEIVSHGSINGSSSSLMEEEEQADTSVVAAVMVKAGTPSKGKRRLSVSLREPEPTGHSMCRAEERGPEIVDEQPRLVLTLPRKAKKT